MLTIHKYKYHLLPLLLEYYLCMTSWGNNLKPVDFNRFLSFDIICLNEASD